MQSKLYILYVYTVVIYIVCSKLDKSKRGNNDSFIPKRGEKEFEPSGKFFMYIYCIRLNGLVDRFKNSTEGFE